MSTTLRSPVKRAGFLFLAIVGGTALGVLILGIGSCADDPLPPPKGTDTKTQQVEARKLSDETWHDLSKIPFRPEWVGGRLTVTRATSPRTLNNLFLTTGDEKVIAKHFLYPHLLCEVPDAEDGRFVLQPWVARSLPKRLDDNRTYVWTLRDDLTWEDGVPLTAHDYAFTWELLCRDDMKQVLQSRRSAMERVENVEAVGDHTLRVTFKEPYYNALVSFGLGFWVSPKHATHTEPTALQQTKRHPSYGAYRISAFDDSRLLLELRPEYRKKAFPLHPAYIEEVEYRFVGPGTDPVQLLKTGATDLTVVPHDAFDQLEGDAAFEKVAWRTWYFLPTWAFIPWNGVARDDVTKPHPILGDERVRRALSHLIPRQRLIEKYFPKRARIVTGPAWFKDGDYDESLAGPAYDPKKAGMMLKAAGWSRDDKGMLTRRGKSFEIELYYPSGGITWAASLATELEAEFKQAGIKLIIKGVAFPNLVSAMLRKNYDATLMLNSLRPPIEPDFFDLFHSSQAQLNANNFVGMASPKVDKLIEESRVEFDPVKRREMRRELHRQINDYHPYSFLFSIASCIGMNKRWANVKVHDLGIWYRDFVLRELWERSPPR